jgi:hypothetical protein
VGPDGEPGPPGEARQWQLLPLPQAPHPRVEIGDDDTVQLRWAPVTGAIGYELELAEDADFERLRLQQAVQAPGLTLPGEDHPVAYLRVRAIAADGAPGPWSAPQRIDGVSHRGAWWVVVLGLLGLLL